MKQSLFTLNGFTLFIALCSCMSTYSLGQTDSLLLQVDKATADLKSLEAVIAKLNLVDSAYLPSFPAWVVDDINLKLRIFAAFRNRGKEFNRDDAIVVIADPDSQTLREIKIGNMFFSRVYAHTLLARDLRQDIIADAHSKKPPNGIKRIGQVTTNPLARPSSPQWVSVDVSLFGASILFNNGLGIIGKVGHDELGYPFWATGQFSIMLAYKSLKFGAWLPINSDLENNARDGIRTTKRSRLINGSNGVTGEFEFEIDALRLGAEEFPYAAIGGRFTFGGLSGRREEFLTPNLDSLYFLSAIAQGYYAFDYLFDDKKQNLNTQIGASFHSVALGKTIVVTGKYEIERIANDQRFIDPYVRIEYRNHRFDRFRLSVQQSRLFMVTAWGEVVPPFIYVELKYATITFRKTKPWEYNNYFFGTVGFKFEF